MAIANADGSIVLNTKVDTGGLNKGFDSMKGSIAKLGKLFAVAFSTKLISSFAKESQTLYKTQMQNEVKLATVMRERVNATNEQIQAILDLTAAEQGLGIIGDEVQIAGLQQLATFSKQTETIETLLPAMNNLIAQQYGFEASTGSAINVANLMGKVLQGQTGALTRVGVTFTEAQEEILKYGSESEKAATLAQVITDNVGEMNRALASTDIGRQQQLSNTIGDIKEQFGEAVTQIAIVFLPLLQRVAEVLKGTVEASQRLAASVAKIFGARSNAKQWERVAIAAGDAAENQEDLNENLEDANKTLKKTLAGFDDLQILTSSAAESEQTNEEPFEYAGVLGSTEASKRELSDFERFVQRLFKGIPEAISKAWDYKPLQDFVQNSKALFTSFWMDLQIGVDKWGKPLLQKMGDLFASIWEGAMSPHLDLVAERWASFVGILGKLWDEHGAPIIDAIGSFTDTTISLFRKIYDKTIEPILKPLFSAFSELWNEYAEPVAKKAGVFFEKLISGIAEIYNDVLAPFVNWYIDWVAPKIEWAGQLIANVFKTVGGVIADVFGRLFEYLGGIVDFVVGVFKGDWDRAWRGIVQSFEAAWGGVGDVIKGVINVAIDAVNGLIAGINKVSIKMPDWDWLPNNVQGKSLGFNVPKIPKLAQGAVVPPNREFLAVLGDNKKENEIVSPVSTMKQAFKEAIAEAGFSGQTQKEEHYYLNETQLMSILYKLVQGGERIKGGSLVGGTA